MGNTRQIYDLKIVIASTPKTGNNWVKQLLAATYNLPARFLTLPFRAAEADALGKRWVAHEHFFPVMDLLDWARENNAIFVTTTRHPADVLVSFYHHVHNQQYGARDQMTPQALAMLQDRKGPGFHTAEYVRNEFYYGVNQSLAWARSGLSLVVRYEDMWRDPVAALTELTEQIVPVGEERIKRAIEQCQIDKLRNLHDPKGRFYRKGTIGNWRTELPEEIQELFRSYEPYPSQLAALGYTMNADDPLLTEPAKRFVFDNPFDGLTHFDNGVPIPPIVEKLYLSLDSVYTARWDSVATTATPDSFLAWVNAPADEDPYRNEAVPVVTNLAAYIYSLRQDVQRQYPDVYGRHRIPYAHWFAMHAVEGYRLHRAYTLPVILSWSTGPAAVIQASEEAVSGPARPASLDQVRATARVNPHQPIAWPEWPTGFWPKIRAAAQKVTRRLLSWYVNPIVEQQNRFNSAVVESQEQMWQEIAQPEEAAQQQGATSEEETVPQEGEENNPDRK